MTACVLLVDVGEYRGGWGAGGGEGARLNQQLTLLALNSSSMAVVVCCVGFEKGGEMVRCRGLGGVRCLGGLGREVDRWRYMYVCVYIFMCTHGPSMATNSSFLTYCIWIRSMRTILPVFFGLNIWSYISPKKKTGTIFLHNTHPPTHTPTHPRRRCARRCGSPCRTAPRRRRCPWPPPPGPCLAWPFLGTCPR